MESKTYTVQDMCDVANFFDRNEELVRQKVMSNAILANIHEVVPMLRQAAEMRERCEEIKSRYCLAKNKFDKSMAPRLDSAYSEIVSKISEFNYILYGNAEKAEK